MSTTAILLTGYPVMAAAIAVLFGLYRKSETARLREALEHKANLKMILNVLEKKKGKS